MMLRIKSLGVLLWYHLTPSQTQQFGKWGYGNRFLGICIGEWFFGAVRRTGKVPPHELRSRWANRPVARSFAHLAEPRGEVLRPDSEPHREEK